MQFRFGIQDTSYPPMGPNLVIQQVKNPVYSFGIVSLHQVENGKHEEILNGYVTEEEFPELQNAIIDFLQSVENQIPIQVAKAVFKQKTASMAMVDVTL